jgi:hypothetical protein
MGKGKKRKTAEKPAPAKPKGLGRTKRTPQHIGDVAAVAEQEYEVEAIVAAGKCSGVESYLIKWKGWGVKSNTWEPLAHLVGAEVAVRAFNVEARRLDAENLQRVSGLAAERREEIAAQNKVAAERLQAKLVASKARAAIEAGEQDGQNEQEQTPAPQRRAKIYKYYADSGENYMTCSMGGTERCLTGICVKDGTSALHNHLKYCHKDIWLEFDKLEHPEKHSDLHGAINGAFDSGVFDSAVADEMFALWIAQDDRPLTMPETDVMLGKIIQYCLRAPPSTEYQCPNYARVYASLIRLEDKGVTVARDFVLAQLADGIQLAAGESRRDFNILNCVAGADIWSDKSISLLGIVLYGIDSNWNMVELLAACTPFSAERHTSGAIAKHSIAAFNRVGLPGGIDDLFKGVTDNGSNIKKAFEGNLGCADHTLKLSVKEFDQHPKIKPTVGKRHGCARILRRGNAARNFRSCQTRLALPKQKCPLDVLTRWNADLDQCTFFESQQSAVIMHDINFKNESEEYAKEAGEAYSAFKLERLDFDTIKQERALLETAGDGSQLLQGTEYPTSNWVMPIMLKLINRMDPATLLEMYNDRMETDVRANCQLLPGVQAARKVVWEDLCRRWVDEIPSDDLEFYLIATLLDPHLKDFDWEAGTDYFRSHALAYATTEFVQNWAPREEGSAAEAEAEQAPAPAPDPDPATNTLPATMRGKKRKVNMAAFIDSGVFVIIDNS